MKDGIEPGTDKYFEYRCWESHSSSDAHLWYRSHCKVTVLKCVNPEYGDITIEERCEAGMALVYCVRFPDGYEGDVWEDELLDSPEEYNRPSPPSKSP